ncbi:hypothetical protein HK405_007224, partial [Cladochytrium tenue]
MAWVTSAHSPASAMSSPASVPPPQQTGLPPPPFPNPALTAPQVGSQTASQSASSFADSASSVTATGTNAFFGSLMAQLGGAPGAGAGVPATRFTWAGPHAPAAASASPATATASVESRNAAALQAARVAPRGVIGDIDTLPSGSLTRANGVDMAAIVAAAAAATAAAFAAAGGGGSGGGGNSAIGAGGGVGDGRPRAMGTLACDRCREKKRRCDGRKPVCSNCSRAQARTGGDEGALVQCFYQPAFQKRGRKRRNASGAADSNSPGHDAETPAMASVPVESSPNESKVPSQNDSPAGSGDGGSGGTVPIVESLSPNYFASLLESSSTLSAGSSATMVFPPMPVDDDLLDFSSSSRATTNASALEALLRDTGGDVAALFAPLEPPAKGPLALVPRRMSGVLEELQTSAAAAERLLMPDSTGWSGAGATIWDLPDSLLKSPGPVPMANLSDIRLADDLLRSIDFSGMINPEVTTVRSVVATSREAYADLTTHLVALFFHFFNPLLRIFCEEDFLSNFYPVNKHPESLIFAIMGYSAPFSEHPDDQIRVRRRLLLAICELDMRSLLVSGMPPVFRNEMYRDAVLQWEDEHRKKPPTTPPEGTTGLEFVYDPSKEWTRIFAAIPEQTIYDENVYPYRHPLATAYSVVCDVDRRYIPTHLRTDDSDDILLLQLNLIVRNLQYVRSRIHAPKDFTSRHIFDSMPDVVDKDAVHNSILAWYADLPEHIRLFPSFEVFSDLHPGGTPALDPEQYALSRPAWLEINVFVILAMVWLHDPCEGLSQAAPGDKGGSLPPPQPTYRLTPIETSRRVTSAQWGVLAHRAMIHFLQLVFLKAGQPVPYTSARPPPPLACGSSAIPSASHMIPRKDWRTSRDPTTRNDWRHVRPGAERAAAGAAGAADDDDDGVGAGAGAGGGGPAAGAGATEGRGTGPYTRASPAPPLFLLASLHIPFAMFACSLNLVSAVVPGIDEREGLGPLPAPPQVDSPWTGVLEIRDIYLPIFEAIAGIFKSGTIYGDITSKLLDRALSFKLADMAASIGSDNAEQELM